MSKTSILESILHAIEQQLRQSLPNEICGYMGWVGRLINSIYLVHNSADTRKTSFVMDPQSQLNALLAVERDKREMIASYQFHPVGAGQAPSMCDLADNDGSGWLYMIISPAENTSVRRLRRFTVRGESFQEIEMQVVRDGITR